MEPRVARDRGEREVLVECEGVDIQEPAERNEHCGGQDLGDHGSSRKHLELEEVVKDSKEGRAERHVERRSWGNTAQGTGWSRSEDKRSSTQRG